MHPLSSSAVELGAKDYQNLIDLYMCTVGPNFISYDMYPVRHHKVEDYIFLNPDWFENLEIIADKARHYKVPMWTFVQSCQVEPCQPDRRTAQADTRIYVGVRIHRPCIRLAVPAILYVCMGTQLGI